MDGYAAGLIDGEGYIGIIHMKPSDTYNVRVQVAMVTKGSPILRRMTAHYGGQISSRPPETEANAAKDVWLLNGQEAHDFLARVEPLLILKRDQARAGMDLWSAILASRAERGRKHWTSELRRHAHHLMLRVQEGNQRGPQEDATPPPHGALAVRRWGEWWQPEDDLFGPAPFLGPLPTSGIMVDGALIALPTWAPATDGSGCSSSPGLLPTPRASWGGSATETMGLLPTPTSSDRNGAGEHGTGGPDLRTAVADL